MQLVLSELQYLLLTPTNSVGNSTTFELLTSCLTSKKIEIGFPLEAKSIDIVVFMNNLCPHLSHWQFQCFE